jgi:hypothetical protein
MDDFLNKLDQKLKEIMLSEKMRKYDFPRSVKDIPTCPFKTHEELLENFKNGNVIIIQGLQMSNVTFSLMATKWESVLHTISLFGPYFVSVILIILSFALSNYWLLLGITFPFIAALLTGPQFFIKLIFPLIALAITIFAILQGANGTVIFFAGYLLCHMLLKINRHVYSRILFRRAFALESAFIFLLTGGYIQLLNKKYEPFKPI